MIKVAQCWDDGCCTDIRLAELFRKYNAKATFNIYPGKHGERRLPASWVTPEYSGWSHNGFRGGKLSVHELTKVYSGFQVASHCMFHESANVTGEIEFVQSALDARHFLEDLFQQECRGFAWPFGHTAVSVADALLRAGFLYGRTTEYTDNVDAYTHPMLLKSSCHFQSGDFYRLFAEAKAANRSFYFWGHSYEMMDSEGMWRQFEDKLRLLNDDPEVVWCDVSDLVKK